MTEVEEYDRIKGLFAGTDEGKLALLDGMIWEAARTRVQLDLLAEQAAQTGLVKIHPDDCTKQKELPVSFSLSKTRSTYINILKTLSKELGRTDDEEDELEEFE